MIMIWDFRYKNNIYRKNQKKLYFFLENIELLYKMKNIKLSKKSKSRRCEIHRFNGVQSGREICGI